MDDIIKPIQTSSDCDYSQTCGKCIKPEHSPLNIVMRFSNYVRLTLLRKLVFLAIVVGTLLLLYVETSNERNEKTLNQKPDSAIDSYETKSDFFDIRAPLAAAVDAAKRDGVVGSLRSLIGMGYKQSTSSKSEIKLDANAEGALRILESNLFKNHTNSSRKSTPSDTIHLIPPERKQTLQGELSRCVSRKSRERMCNLFGGSYNPNLAPFIGLDYKRIPNLMSLPPPFGFQKSEQLLQAVLSIVNKTDIDATKGKRCTRCIVVGNGGILLNRSFGKTIDEMDVVIRLNDALTAGYERDVGSKTTIRIGYPESSFQKSGLYRGNWLYVMAMFKAPDLDWLLDVASGKSVRKSLHFWKSVAQSVPKPADEFRIFNPLIVRETANLIGFHLGDGHMNKNVPTTGSFAISMALRACDEVSVVGFGYSEDKPLHYYDSLQMKVVKQSHTHNIRKEKEWLRKLVQQGVIHDMTGGIV